jgi:DNA-directed RNA polymerase specialized sigma24 family protein
VLVLHDVEGYRHEEIAEMQGTAVGTSKAQLHRARRLLREMLGR